VGAFGRLWILPSLTIGRFMSESNSPEDFQRSIAENDLDLEPA
jgi:hypothetical protein